MPSTPKVRAHEMLALVAALLLFSVSTACVAESPPSPKESAAVTDHPLTDQHPGTTDPYADALRSTLADALVAKGDAYEPRTHHLRDDGTPRWTNRLILEDSPYLLQHAHNPVDWYPWGDEAFERARREDKPIFLSIGYSTCHWCHVMERESFESEAIAALMNSLFVCVKIDRERRPDIDELYMTAVQLLTRRGGWPMSSFLTPEGEPFYGGTYFPPDRFSLLLQRVADAWQSNRGEVEDTAQRLTAAVREATAARGTAKKLADGIAERAVAQTLSRYDATLGGFGRAPKFPNEPELLFLLTRNLRQPQASEIDAVVHTLEAMARGGIYDQVGGGFHRYSVDAQWLVPHFEKMLYNQAHLSRAYALGHQLTGDPFFARIARQTLDYVLREMTAPGGGFYSATDADSDNGAGESEEGAFFVWSPETLKEALGPDDAKLAIDLWGVTPGGNFEGHSILHLPRALDEYAAATEQPLDALLTHLDRINETLWRVREERPHPLRDDKILTAWNGMMITAFADASRQLHEPRYLDAATAAAEFLWQHNRRPGDTLELWRVHLDGSSSIPALQEDYAYLAEAFIALYDASGERRWLERARRVADRMLDLFWDDGVGGFFMGAEGADANLIGRPKSPNDGAIPSGNSVALRALGQLARRTGEALYQQRAEATAAAFAETIERMPVGFAYMLLGLEELEHGRVGDLQYGALGNLRVEAKIRAEAELRVEAKLEPGDGGRRDLRLTLQLADGWHINARQPRQEELIPTTLDAPGLVEVHFPDPEELTVAFQDESLLVHGGRFEIQAALEDVEGGTVPVELRFQACENVRCLRPETLVLELFNPR